MEAVGSGLGCVLIGLGLGVEAGPLAFVVDADDLDDEGEVAGGHVSRCGVEALASCPQILHYAQPWWVVISNGSTQWRYRQAVHQAAMQRQHSGRCCCSRTDP